MRAIVFERAGKAHLAEIVAGIDFVKIFAHSTWTNCWA
jgi:hypothetical protein